METLSEVVKKYLEENGIMFKYFADYIGCEYTKCSNKCCCVLGKRRKKWVLLKITKK